MNNRSKADATFRQLSVASKGLLIEIGKVKQERDNIMRSADGKLSIYGPRMADIKRTIQADRGYVGNVFGPLGMHVKLDVQYKEYSRSVETGIGRRMLTAFLVSSSDDRRRLFATLQRFGAADHHTIIVKPASSSRYAIQPIPGLLTIADTLIIEEDAVFNALVDQGSIERALLVRDYNDCMQNYVTLINGKRSFRHNQRIDRSVNNSPPTFLCVCIFILPPSTRCSRLTWRALYLFFATEISVIRVTRTSEI